jgi:hypothetical protein
MPAAHFATPACSPRFASALALLAALAWPGLAGAHGEGAHGPHEHGAATLALVLEGETLVVELLTPAANLLGFERLPANEAERAALQAAVATLQRGGELLGLPAAAQCRQQSTQIESPLLAVYDNRDRQRPDEAPVAAAGAHADFDISYRFGCAVPGALTGLDLQLFERFPGLQRLTVEWVVEARQSAATATPAQPRVALK